MEATLVLISPGENSAVWHSAQALICLVQHVGGVGKYDQVSKDFSVPWILGFL